MIAYEFELNMLIYWQDGFQTNNSYVMIDQNMSISGL